MQKDSKLRSLREMRMRESREGGGATPAWGPSRSGSSVSVNPGSSMNVVPGKKFSSS